MKEKEPLEIKCCPTDQPIELNQPNEILSHPRHLSLGEVIGSWRVVGQRVDPDGTVYESIEFTMNGKTVYLASISWLL